MEHAHQPVHDRPGAKVIGGKVDCVVSGSSDREAFRRRVDDAVLVLFALVSEAVGWATTALLDQDVELAERVVADDRAIDERCEELTAFVKERLAGSPSARDELEDLIAILQIVPELERSADLAEHVAQRALRSVGGIISPRSRGLIQRMSDVAVGMWKVAGNAYRQRSRDARFALKEADDELDALASSLVREGVTSSVETETAVELALLARFYERLGDHAVNLAARVEAMASPRRLTPPRASPLHRATGTSTDERQAAWRRVLGRLTRLRLVPAEEGFFELFEAAAANCRDCAEALSKLIALREPDEYFEQVRVHERRGDELTTDVLRRLDASFVTPYDREDIHGLAEALDDVVDDMFSAASLLQLTGGDEPLPEFSEQAETLVAIADELVALMACLRRGGEGARFRLERIEHLERQGDAVFRRGMGRLYGGAYDALTVIKWKDIIYALEESLNAVEDASNVVEGILVKNS